MGRLENRKNRGRYAVLSAVLIIIIIGLIGYIAVNHTNKGQSGEKKETTTTKSNSRNSSGKVSKAKAIDLAGTYFSNDGQEATIVSRGSNKWQINYAISNEKASATFSTKWTGQEAMRESTTAMKKSDGYDDFKITIQVKKEEHSAKKQILLTMSDGTKTHEMSFANQQDYFTQDSSEGPNKIIQGDLTDFEGTYSNDRMEKAIADSGFTLNAYSPEDYYQNKTTVFPSISTDGTTWYFWSGSMRANYHLNVNKLPQKVNDYYEAYFIDADENELILTLVPPNVTGPDGVVSSGKRVLYGQKTIVILRDYEDGWWQKYPAPETKKDLDPVAITSGDFSTLVGTWKNGLGNSFTVHADGSIAGLDNGTLQLVQNANSASKIPYLALRTGAVGGSALGLLKIGFTNPDGDQSDQTKPRLIITQSAGNYPANQYYYRQ
jgi:uncharacterized protein (UPF0333 family)